MEASILNIEDIQSVEVIPSGAVYDLTVEENHNFYLATNTQPILVHNSGKSTWLDYMSIRLSIFKNWKFGIFSPENIPQLKLMRMAEQLLGKPLSKMSRSELQAAIDFLGQHYVFYNVDKIEDYSLTNLLNIGGKMVRRLGIDALILDPFNYIELDGDEKDHTQRIGQLLRKLKLFAVRNDVLVILVAHPRKMDKQGEQYVVPRMYDISGSHHFFNVPDWGIVVHRTYVDGTNDPVQIHVQKHKYHFRGKLGSVDYIFDRSTGQYSEDGIFKSLFHGAISQKNESDLFSSQ